MNLVKSTTAPSRAILSAYQTIASARLATALPSLPCARLLSTQTRDPPPHTLRNSPQSNASTQRLEQRPSGNARSSSKDDKKKEEEKELRKPRNEEIKYAVVRLVNPETGALDPPTPLREILPRVNRKEEYLELVKAEPEPIVKIQNVKEQYRKEKAKRLVRASKKPPEEKEVQLTWGVSIGDLQAKLRKVREELEDGNRVNLVFARKKGQALLSPAEQEKMVKEALRLLEDVARERKERMVQNHAAGLFLESTRVKKTVELRWKQADDDSWEGLKGLENALRQGERVEAIFILPPPPAKEKKKNVKEDEGDAAQAVDPAIVQERVERTLGRLLELGQEWKPRDVRKGVIIVHLEGKKA
ncbi:hypothetical protein BD414DRAFT_537408 [Trametes punicea]|nr:hypothetical protein BD414DRAFT_537408 [Trametes punicea]